MPMVPMPPPTWHRLRERYATDNYPSAGDQLDQPASPASIHLSCQPASPASLHPSCQPAWLPNCLPVCRGRSYFQFFYAPHATAMHAVQQVFFGHHVSHSNFTVRLLPDEIPEVCQPLTCSFSHTVTAVQGLLHHTTSPLPLTQYLLIR